jgi:hypothetical protein
MPIAFSLLTRFWWAIPLLLLSITTAYYRHDAAQEREQRHIIAAEYKAFTAQVETLGREAEARNRAIVQKQKDVSNEVSKSYANRLDIINREYARLRDDKAGRSGNPVPPDATAAKPSDDAARDAELLAFLRQAEVQTSRLEALQNWLRSVR